MSRGPVFVVLSTVRNLLIRGLSWDPRHDQEDVDLKDCESKKDKRKRAPLLSLRR